MIIFLYEPGPGSCLGIQGYISAQPPHETSAMASKSEFWSAFRHRKRPDHPSEALEKQLTAGFPATQALRIWRGPGRSDEPHISIFSSDYTLTIGESLI
jgi:hypothetical protein